MAAVELPGLRRVAYGVVLAQAVLTALLAMLCYIPWGLNVALSVALGGGIGTAGSLALAMIVVGGVHVATVGRFVRTLPMAVLCVAYVLLPACLFAFAKLIRNCKLG